MSIKSNVLFFSSREVYQLFQTMIIHNDYQAFSLWQTQRRAWFVKSVRPIDIFEVEVP